LHPEELAARIKLASRKISPLRNAQKLPSNFSELANSLESRIARHLPQNLTLSAIFVETGSFKRYGGVPKFLTFRICPIGNRRSFHNVCRAFPGHRNDLSPVFPHLGKLKRLKRLPKTLTFAEKPTILTTRERGTGGIPNSLTFPCG
jgi:hypothetical protein